MSVLRSAVVGVRSFLGLYSLFTLGLSLVSLLIAVLLFIFLPDLRNTARILVALAVLLLALFVVGAYSDVKGSILARQTRYGTNTGVMVTAFVGIAVLINLISVENHRRFDLTAGGQYTLARQTITVLKNLKAPIRVTGFFPKDSFSQASLEGAKSLLTEYRYHTDKISFEFIDPDDKPSIARQYNIGEGDYGALVFEQEDRRKKVYSLQEQDFTGAILNVTGTVQPKVYFITGHGERDVEDSNEAGSGFGFVKKGLLSDNYEVLTLNLSTVDKVPSNAAVLVVAGPIRPYLPPEVDLINVYLDAGGKALVLLDPDPLPELRGVLARWGVTVKGGMVVDLGRSLRGDPASPAVGQEQFFPSPITRGLDGAVFLGAAGLEVSVPKDDEDHVTVSPLAITTLRSFLETNKDTINFDEAEDTRGPLLLAAVVEANKPIGQRPQRSSTGGPGTQDPKITRLVAIADSDFATNKYFSSLRNGDFLLNSVNWLTAQEELISIRPKPSAFRPLVITSREWDFLLYSSVALLPLAVLLAGGVAWWRRR